MPRSHAGATSAHDGAGSHVVCAHAAPQPELAGSANVGHMQQLDAAPTQSAAVAHSAGPSGFWFAS